jgi:monoamine oxidase
MLDVAIVGGGLCGVALAHGLQARQWSWTLFEARDRLGGRVLTVQGAGGVPVDLGATWYWPATQPSIARLVDELGLASFAQADDGRVLLLDDPNRPPHPVAVDATGSATDAEVVHPAALHAGARRIEGGMAALVDALVAALPTQRFVLGHALERLVDRGSHVELHFGEGEGDGEAGGRHDAASVVVARRVVLALPPRIAAATIAFEPPLAPERLEAMRATPTWMATAAKAAAVYREAFWRDAGHTGNAWVTHPQAVLAEVYDAGPPPAAAGAALAGFVALGADARRHFGVGLPMLIGSQFAMLFGPAAEGGELHRHDWAEEPRICSALDLAEDGSAAAPPHYGEAGLEAPLWQGRLYLGGSETARRHGGYLEGALGTAARLRRVLDESIRLARAAAANDPQADAGPVAPEATEADPFAPWLRWVGAQRNGSLEAYRRRLNERLARQDLDQLTQRSVLGALEALYAEALDRLRELPCAIAPGPVERGRHALTPRLLQPFVGLADELLAEAIRFNGGSCALSNFPYEHRPDPAYVQTIRRDLAAAWKAFALDLNDCLHAKARAADAAS